MAKYPPLEMKYTLGLVIGPTCVTGVFYSCTFIVLVRGQWHSKWLFTSGNSQCFLQGHHGKQKSHNMLLLRAYKHGSWDTEKLNLWIALNFSLRYLDFILQLRLITEQSSTGKTWKMWISAQEGRNYLLWKIAAWVFWGNDRSFFSPSDTQHRWSNATNLRNIQQLWEIYTCYIPDTLLETERKQNKITTFLKEMHSVFERVKYMNK